MLDIQPAILRVYQAALDHDNVPVDQRPHFVRWLRYYLDFCHKNNAYRHWLRQFQTFVLSKDPASADIEDVKAFLC